MDVEYSRCPTCYAALENVKAADMSPQDEKTMTFSEAVQYDEDGNDHIELGEFTQIANSMGVTNNDVIANLFAANDPNGSGRSGDNEWIGNFEDTASLPQSGSTVNERPSENGDNKWRGVISRINAQGGAVILDWDNTIDSGSGHKIQDDAAEWLNAFAEHGIDAHLVTGNGDEEGIRKARVFN